MAKTTTTSTASAARRIVQEGSDIRARMHDLVSTALADGRLDLSAAREAAKGVGEALSATVPTDHANVLRQVLDGMSEAVAAAANAATKTLDHAAKAGKKLSTSEVKKLSTALNSLEHDFLTAVRGAAGTMSDRAGEEWTRMLDQAKHAGTAIRPAAGKALSAASKHAPSLALETVKVGAKAARVLTGELAMGLSGVLSGVGSALRGPKPAKKAAAKKKTRVKKPAKSAKKAAKKKKSKR